jgi:hypothetical protein
MQLELSKSCWPKRNEYKTTEDIVKNIADFRIDLLIYIDRFEDKLILFGYSRKSRKYIPKNVFKKGGSDPGLADYFIGGRPDKNFGLRVWTSVQESKRKDCKSFERFKKLYLNAVEAIEGRERDKEVNRQICFGVKEMIKTDETQRSSHSKSKDYQRSSRLHNAQDEMANDLFDEDGSQEEIEIVFTKDSMEGEEMPSGIDPPDDGNEEDSQITEEDVSQLANLLQPPDSKTQGICYDMLYKGKCEKVNCPYNHKAEEIEKAKKLKALRFTSSRTPSKQVSFTRAVASTARKT